METTSALVFSTLARRLASAAHQEGLTVPGFRSPPRVPNRTRTVRRYADGAYLVSVVTHGRASPEVLADMIEGVLVTNRLRGPAGEAARAALWRRLDTSAARAA